MKTMDRPFQGSTLVLSLLLTAFLGVRCSSNGPDTSNDTSADGGHMNAPPAATAPSDPADRGSTPAATVQEPGYLDANGSGVPGARTAADERTGAMNAMNGLRASLMAELERVRTRLNDGTRPEAAAKADKERAAELAQGLERVDRALVAMGGATDAMWSEMRTTRLKEVDEVRAWLNGHKEERASNEASASK